MVLLTLRHEYGIIKVGSAHAASTLRELTHSGKKVGSAVLHSLSGTLGWWVSFHFTHPTGKLSRGQAEGRDGWSESPPQRFRPKRLFSATSACSSEAGERQQVGWVQRSGTHQKKIYHFRFRHKDTKPLKSINLLCLVWPPFRPGLHVSVLSLRPFRPGLREVPGERRPP